MPLLFRLTLILNYNLIFSPQMSILHTSHGLWSLLNLLLIYLLYRHFTNATNNANKSALSSKSFLNKCRRYSRKTVKTVLKSRYISITQEQASSTEKLANNTLVLFCHVRKELHDGAQRINRERTRFVIQDAHFRAAQNDSGGRAIAKGKSIANGSESR